MNQPTPAAGLLSSGLIGYCRAGFEKELAGEIDDLAVEAGLLGFVRAEPNTGYAVFETFEPTPLGSFGAATDWRRPCFARQLLPWFARVDKLPERDRATPIVAAVKASGQRFSGVLLETPDTDEAKQRSGFCKRFTEPLSTALEKAGCLRSSRAGLPYCTFCSPMRTPPGSWPAKAASARPGRWVFRDCACRRTPPAARR